ncbi:MAG: hypothetical protein U1E16_14320 [Hyphomicrobiales bacterium]
MFAELAILDDDRWAKHGGIKPVVTHAAPPGVEDQRVARGVTALGDAGKLPDMLNMGERDGPFSF